MGNSHRILCDCLLACQGVESTRAARTAEIWRQIVVVGKRTSRWRLFNRHSTLRGPTLHPTWSSTREGQNCGSCADERASTCNCPAAVATSRPKNQKASPISSS